MPAAPSIIRLVSFDALHTIITPRLPIHVQYSEIFTPYLGVLDPDSIAHSFKFALKQVSIERPAYRKGVSAWWEEVIRRTAIGAGADAQAVSQSLDEIVPRLIHRFSSKEGYKLFDDTVETLEALKEMNVRTALVTGADSRILSALEDLSVLHMFSPIITADKECLNKPSMSIFLCACVRGGVKPQEAVHVGDDIHDDYWSSWYAGYHPLLLRRPGADGAGERKERGEDTSTIRVVSGLDKVVRWVFRRNGQRNGEAQYDLEGLG